MKQTNHNKSFFIIAMGLRTVALLYLFYIPLCLRKSASLMSFLLLTGICLLQSVCIALWTICEYKLSYL